MASISKRANGKYLARWREYPSGPQTTKQFARKIDAENWLTEVQHRLLTGTYTPPSAGQMTVRAYSEEWMSRRAWAPATHDRIERAMRLHILPRFGAWPIVNVRRSHLEEWARQLGTTPRVRKRKGKDDVVLPPLQQSSIRMLFEALSAMFAAAVDDERIPRNPAVGARVAFGEETPFVPLTVEEVHGLVIESPEHVRGGLVVAAGTGLRQGELFGLTVDRLDLLRRELRVDRQLWTPAKGTPILKAPKSKNSNRTVALSTLVVDVLAAHLAAFGPGEHGLVFHIDGRPVSRAMAAKYMRQASAGAGVKATWHDLRHHHASTLLSEGVNPAKVADRLGHDLKTLLTTYAHVMPVDDDRVRGIVDATLGERAEDWLRTEAV